MCSVVMCRRTAAAVRSCDVSAHDAEDGCSGNKLGNLSASVVMTARRADNVISDLTGRHTSHSQSNNLPVATSNVHAFAVYKAR